MTADDYAYAAVLSHIGWQQVPTGTPYKRASLESRLLSAIGVEVPKKLVDAAIDKMADQNLLDVIETGIGEPYLKINYKPINEYVTARSADKKTPEYVYRRIGKQILIDLFSGDSDLDVIEPSDELNEPPATLTEAHRAELVSEIDRIVVKLDGENVSNEVKAQASAYLSAAKVLAESPEPPSGIIWDLIERASQLAGIAALFVTIISLFGH